MVERRADYIDLSGRLGATEQKVIDMSDLLDETREDMKEVKVALTKVDTSVEKLLSLILKSVQEGEINKRKLVSHEKQINGLKQTKRDIVMIATGGGAIISLVVGLCVFFYKAVGAKVAAILF